MAEESKFSKLPKNQLVFISERLLDDGFDAINLYDDYSSKSDSLKRIAKYFSIIADEIDVQFFAKFITINDELLANIFDENTESVGYNKELVNKLIIPTPKEYRLEYTIYGTCNYREELYSNFSSYDKNWVSSLAEWMEREGEWYPYEGELINDIDYYNQETDEVDYDDAEVIEITNENTNESLLDRLVIENTSEVVSSLDKQTLLKLKRIIDSRLSSL